jgi:hypothetical protein
MRDLAPYLYPLIFAALVLLNYLMQRIAKWQKQQSAAKEESTPKRDDVQKSLEELKRRREQLAQKRSQLQRPRKQTAARAERPVDRTRRERVVQDEPVEVRQARARASRPETPAPPATGAPRVSGVRALIADQRSLRQAIVLMTVLGPCRAQQSPAAVARGTLHDE